MSRQTGADDFTVEDVKGREQGCRAVSLIVMRLPFRDAWPQWQNGRGPIQGLDLALLIHAEYQRSFRWVQIQADHVPHLVLKTWIARKFELLHTVCLDAVLLPYPLHHHARQLQFRRQSTYTPVGCVRRSGFQCRIQDLLLRVCSQDRTCPPALLPLHQRGDSTVTECGPYRQDGRPRQAGLPSDRTI